MRKVFVLCTVLIVSAQVVAAQISDPLTDWIDGPYSVLLTPEEREEMQSLKDDVSAARFLALVWARRDPDPETPVNEFQREFEHRIIAADHEFAEKGIRGALSDRGRVFLLFGPPAVRQRAMMSDVVESLYNDQPSGGSHPALNGIGPKSRSMGIGFAVTDLTRDVAPTATFLEGNDSLHQTLRHGIRFDLDRGMADVWIYEAADWPEVSGKAPLQAVFFDPFGTGHFEFHTGTNEPGVRARFLATAASHLLTAPSLERCPNHPLIPGIPAATDAQLSALEQPPLRAPSKSESIAVRGIRGDGTVPVWIYLQLPEGLSSVDTIVGRLIAHDGTVTGSFQVPAVAALDELGNGYVELDVPAPKTASTIDLVVLSGQQRVADATFEIADASRSVTSPYFMPFVAGARVEEVSGNALSDPFVFGGHHLVLRPSGRYATSENLNLFCLIANPGETNEGQLDTWMSLRLLRKSDGSTVRFIPKRTTQPVRLAPGIYMIALELSLNTLHVSGPHTLELTVHDEMTGTVQESTLELEIGSI